MCSENESTKNECSDDDSAERSPSEVLLEEEITKLRSAVYNLQQIKQRNAHEEQLLKIFQAKLKALHTI